MIGWHGFGMVVLLGVMVGCEVTPGTPATRFDDEIVVAGQRFRIGTPVVLWTDPGGYDAYRVDKRFTPLAESSFGEWPEPRGNPQRYNLRRDKMTDEQQESVRSGGWTLDELRGVVDQFVMHYDVAGTARRCFDVLHDHRHLSVHFLLDIDGTIYQTLDVQERAWHAAEANGRSVGIEIAHIGAYGLEPGQPWEKWYPSDADGRVQLVPPRQADRRSIRTPNFDGRPARPQPIVGTIQGRRLQQYDFTPQQYDALIHLTAGLHRVLPGIKLQAPRDEKGNVVDHVLTPEQLKTYHGVLGHYHISDNKIDPGPAFDWDRVIDGARRLAR